MQYITIHIRYKYLYRIATDIEIQVPVSPVLIYTIPSVPFCETHEKESFCMPVMGCKALCLEENGEMPHCPIQLQDILEPLPPLFTCNNI